MLRRDTGLRLRLRAWHKTMPNLPHAIGSELCSRCEDVQLQWLSRCSVSWIQKLRVFAVSKATVTYSFQMENGFGSAISIQCENSEPLKFRQGTHSKYVMEKVKLLWGDGLLFDHEGYAITAKSPVLSPGFYTYRRCLQSKYCIQPASV